MAIALILCPAVLVVLRRWRVLDVPNERSSHLHPTPRGGGLAVAVAALAGGLVSRGPGGQRAVLLLVAVAMGAVGLAEDLVGISVPRRLALQMGIGALAAPFLASGVGLGLPVEAGAAVLSVVWLAAFVNAFNFMDGINGISAVQVIVAGAAYAWLGRGHHPLLVDGGLAAAAAAAGFLPFNFPRARMFLGDIGSYLLGGWLAVLAVLAVRDGLGLVAAGAPLALYVADTGTTLLRRIAQGEAWMQPHRSHAYQRLVVAGWSHAASTTLVGLTVLVCSALGIAARGRPVPVQAGLAVAIAVVVGAYLVSPALTGRRHPVPA